MIKLLLTLVVIAQAVSAQTGAKCTNPAIQWTINSLYIDGRSSLIQGDGSPYVDGQSGVTAVINVCSGSYDATLQTGSRRSVRFSFANLLASNPNTPTWAFSGSTSSVSGAGGFNVRNLWFVPKDSNRHLEYTFTTRLGSTPPAPGSPDFTMTNPAPDAPSNVPNLLAIANVPYNDSLVIVHHCPANTNTDTCPQITNETWFVYPDPNPTADGVSLSGLPITQVGTLLTTTRNGSKVNAGEFSMSFFFTISLL